MEFTLMNGKKVQISNEELKIFITTKLISNPYWKFSKLVDSKCIFRYFRDNASQTDLKQILEYILIYSENMGFTLYMIDKNSQEFTMKRLSEIRELYHAALKDESLLKPNLEKINALNSEAMVDPF